MILLNRISSDLFVETKAMPRIFFIAIILLSLGCNSRHQTPNTLKNDLRNMVKMLEEGKHVEFVENYSRTYHNLPKNKKNHDSAEKISEGITSNYLPAIKSCQNSHPVNIERYRDLIVVEYTYNASDGLDYKLMFYEDNRSGNWYLEWPWLP